MKCLSVRQPWAALILHGVNGQKKDVENRAWPTKFRGAMLIHASKSVDEGALAGLREEVRTLPPTHGRDANTSAGNRMPARSGITRLTQRSTTKAVNDE